MRKIILLLILFSFVLTACSNQIKVGNVENNSDTGEIVINDTENNSENGTSEITTHAKTTDEFDFIFEDVEKMVIINKKGEIEINKTDTIFNLTKEAAFTDNIPNSNFIAAFTTVKVYFKNGQSAELGTMFSDEKGKMYLVSDYNNTLGAALLIDDKSVINTFIFPER